MSYDYHIKHPTYDADSLRLEAVTTSVGFDDLLDYSLELNHPHLDTAIIVTTHEDRKTQAVARKHGAICVLTDLFTKNGRVFNKGAAINAGFDYFQYYGWRAHLDADTILPDNCRRILFSHTYLDRDTIYGADRVDVIGVEELHRVRSVPQHTNRFSLSASGPISHRYVHTLEGYIPIGYFQLWHSSTQKPYPYSLGGAAHDDTMFGALWPRSHRRLLPTIICQHLCAKPPTIGENWDGTRRQPRLDA